MNLLITICARGGSKEIPRKNIRPINGVPLISYSIQHALEYAKKTGADVELSTDSDEIKNVAKKAGLVTMYNRPEELATDYAGKLGAIKDVLLFAEQNRQKTYDYVLDLDVTSPLRTLEDLEEALVTISNNHEASNIFSVSPPKHNPYFDMVEPNENGFFELIKNPSAQMMARQQGPQVYELNASFYYYKRSFFEDETLMLPNKSLAYVMTHMCFEIDSLIELEFLEYLLKERKLDFDFY